MFDLSFRAANYATQKGRLMMDLYKHQKAANKVSRYQQIDNFVDTKIKPATEEAALADKFGVPQSAATAGKKDTIQFLTKLPQSKNIIEKESKKVVSALDKLVLDQIDSVGKAKSPSEITDDLSDFLKGQEGAEFGNCLLYTSPSPRDGLLSRMPSSA